MGVTIAWNLDLWSITVAVISFPTDAEIEATFIPYAKAVGQVAHAWNYLQEGLGLLFASVTGMDHTMALSIWYSSTSDRAQREMLRAAALSAPADSWTRFPPSAKDDVLWLLRKADQVANQRNDAVHAPCMVATDATGRRMYPAFLNGNPRAKNLLGKNLLSEFAWYEACADTLLVFTRRIQSAYIEPSFPWPARPSLPTQGSV